MHTIFITYQKLIKKYLTKNMPNKTKNPILNLKKVFTALALAGFSFSIAALPASAQLQVDSNLFNVVDQSSLGGECSMQRPCIIYPQEATFNPTKNNNPLFGEVDLAFKINGSGSGTNNFLPEIKTGAVCWFQIKKFDATDDNATKGYAAMLSKITTQNGSTRQLGDMNQDGTNDSLLINFDPVNGCGFKFPAANQDTPTWQIKALVVNPDQSAYIKMPAYFFKYGAVGVVDISAENI